MRMRQFVVPFVFSCSLTIALAVHATTRRIPGISCVCTSNCGTNTAFSGGDITNNSTTGTTAISCPIPEDSEYLASSYISWKIYFRDANTASGQIIEVHECVKYEAASGGMCGSNSYFSTSVATTNYTSSATSTLTNSSWKQKTASSPYITVLIPPKNGGVSTGTASHLVRVDLIK